MAGPARMLLGRIGGGDKMGQDREEMRHAPKSSREGERDSSHGQIARAIRVSHRFREGEIR